MSSIPSEIIIEDILLRLPPKSLGRLKSVSKEWKSVISDPRFIKTHTHQLLLQPKPTKRLLAVSEDTRSLYSIDLTIDNIINNIPATTKEITLGSPPIRWNNIVGSCNGLVLARDVNGDMFLMNPTTHDLWKLPVNPFADGTDAFCYHYGFGYDSSSDDYKVVFICFDSSIYSLRNNSWRKLPRSRNDLRDSCALVNGNCHWLAKFSQSILAFSFVDELFFEIKPPDPVLNGNYSWICVVVEISRKLGVYFSPKSGGADELWVMQEYGDAKSWTRMCSHKYWKRPVCLVEGSDRDIVLKGMCDDAVVVFNMDERRDRKVRILGVPSYDNESDDDGPYGGCGDDEDTEGDEDGSGDDSGYDDGSFEGSDYGEEDDGGSDGNYINNIEGTIVESIESIKRINTLAFQLR